MLKQLQVPDTEATAVLLTLTSTASMLVAIMSLQQHTSWFQV
jgi:hypothetical protein